MDRRDVLSALTSVLTASAVAGCLRASEQVADSDSTTEPNESTTSDGPDETTRTTEPAVEAELRWQSNVDAISGAIGSERVFLQTENSVVALSRDGGDVVWEFDQFGESKALTDPVAGPGWVAVGNTSPDETGTTSSPGTTCSTGRPATANGPS